MSFIGIRIPATLWPAIVDAFKAEGYWPARGLREKCVATATALAPVPAGYEGYIFPKRHELAVHVYPFFPKDAAPKDAGKVTANGTRKSASAASAVTKGWKHPETGQLYTGKGWWLVKANYERRHTSPAVATAKAAVTTAQAQPTITTGTAAGSILVLDGVRYAVVGDKLFAL